MTLELGEKENIYSPDNPPISMHLFAANAEEGFDSKAARAGKLLY